MEELKKLNLRSCLQCGTCTSTCPSGRYTNLNTRRIIYSALNNNPNILHDKDLWLCSTCYKCQDQCPRGIQITDSIFEIRCIAVKHGFIQESHKIVADNVLQTGHAVPITKEVEEQRKNLGLEELPNTTHKYPDALEEVKKLLKSTGFDKLVKSESS
ncbi:MAG TPA: CoB--CoM heterodisulfide reductase subunit C [Methanosarcinales archaeon]|nr:CoB--CoM heterodisulfide reductase subunit C [Methanosarcinales archaeon]